MGFLDGTKSGKQKDEALSKMYLSDFEKADVQGKNGELYQKYQNYFEELKGGIDSIELVAEQFDGMTEGITDSSNHVKRAVQFLADGSAKQAEDIERCKNVADQLTGRISIMDSETGKMLEQVHTMEQQSSKGRENVENLSIVDMETAERLGDRTVGSIKNSAWYEVDNEYNLIKYKIL